MPKFVQWTILSLLGALLVTAGIYLLFFWFGTNTSAIDPAKDSFVMVDGYRMYYRYLPANGDVQPDQLPTLVLVHSEAWPSNEYDRLVKQLRGKMNVYVVDLLGYGKSDKPQRRYDTVYYERTLREGLQQLPAKRMSLLGNSATGSIVLRIANEQPDRYNHVVWLNPLGFGEVTLGLAAILQIPVLGELNGLPVQSLFRLSNLQGMFTGSDLPTEQADELYNATNWYTTSRARLAIYRNVLTPRGIAPEYTMYVEDTVRNAQVNTTLIWGEDDMYATADQAMWARELNPDRVRTVTVPDAEHNVHLINAKQLVDPITEAVRK